MPIRAKILLQVLCLWLFAPTGLPAHIEARASDAESRPSLETNQQLLEEIKKPSDLDIGNLHAVFEFVFSSLADQVDVYPTENYYYFSFYLDGVRYSGNLRLAAADRDKNVLHFAYFADTGVYGESGDVHYKMLSSADGVEVIRLKALEYQVDHLGKKVIFRLNDLSPVVPPDRLLRDEEIYIGPVFDESGIEFFLVFNSDRRIFHYLLNETGNVPDHFRPSGFSHRILIGQRTGFAFYQDRYLARKTLIGVHAANVRANNYLDGPFDQLPENFIVLDRLKTAIEASDSSVKGEVDRLGYLHGGASRYLIDPYISYLDPRDLKSIEDCAGDPSVSRAVYPSCFAPRSTEQLPAK